MKPKDVFRIIVATVALVGFCYGMLDAIEGLLFKLGLLELQRSHPGYYVAKGMLEMVLAIFIMKGGIPFADIAFPESKPDEKDQKTVS